jgi:hypothetical protein
MLVSLSFKERRIGFHANFLRIMKTRIKAINVQKTKPKPGNNSSIKTI